MLLFNLDAIRMYKLQNYHLKTSYVIVQQFPPVVFPLGLDDLKTSYVIVQHKERTVKNGK